jgi:quinohemoprotein amine dehydrogenase
MKRMRTVVTGRLAAGARIALALWLPVVAGLGLTAAPAHADEAMLGKHCGACHVAGEGGLSRIAGQRKSPEGWMMTIVRMQNVHGVQLGAQDRRALVQWLSDTQGLAPSETKGWRYAFEKDPNVVESVEAPLGEMCARCHTGARVALQRRTAEEWLLHMDFHVGQFPTVEYQALGRDRQWYRIAREEIAPMLAERYPFETDAWKVWSSAEHASPAGEWVVMADMPGGGQAYGRLKVAGEASPYRVTGRMTLPDGRDVPAAGSMNLYTGYEWRANVSIGGVVYRQVLAISEDGEQLSGRQFERRRDSLGGALRGVRADAGPTLLGLAPSAVPAGAVTVQAVGVGLDDLAFSANSGTVTRNPAGATLSLSHEGNGIVSVTLGEQERALAVYSSLDRIAVEPAFTIARVGGGSPQGPRTVPSHFRAIGYWNGPDNAPGTDDDVRVGEVTADWSVAPNGEAAEAMQDARFAGVMGDGGLFMPAVAGPNPNRPFSTNNAGDLKVTAKVGELTAEAHLIVTVQRFIDPPLR